MSDTSEVSPDLDVSSLIREIHRRIEAAESKQITHEEMAGRLAISKRTYVEYLRGTNRPKGLGVMFHLLQMLDHEDLVNVLTPLAGLSGAERETAFASQGGETNKVQK